MVDNSLKKFTAYFYFIIVGTRKGVVTIKNIILKTLSNSRGFARVEV